MHCLHEKIRIVDNIRYKRLRFYCGYHTIFNTKGLFTYDKNTIIWNFYNPLPPRHAKMAKTAKSPYRKPTLSYSSEFPPLYQKYVVKCEQSLKPV